MVNQTDSRIYRADLIEQTWLGVVNRLEKLYSKQSKIVNKNIQVVPSGDIDDSEYLQQQKTEQLALPFIGVAPVGIETDVNSYNTSVMRREGYPILMDEDRANYTILKLAPVLMTFQVMFVTDDVLTLMRMIDRWTSNEIWGFKFESANSSWKTNIQVEADKTIQIPARIPSAGNARQFRLQTTLRAKTYSGSIWFVPSIRYTEIQTLIPLEGTIVDAMENPAILASIVNTQLVDSDPYMSPVIYQPQE